MGISRIYQIPVNELLRLNKLKIRSNIHAGQKIIITAKTESPAQKITVHIVKKNDTLSSISRYYKISMQNIKSNNKIYNDKLFIGQRLFIPVKDDKVHLTEYNFSWPVSGRVVDS
ncbi:LysM peptidoglycan-binding domain-containing protein [Candidatus Desantisbacteria bacterium]|nr:LysM peptidoglycan-binding domain-containing protein [Candidatus Desantisbacteria bacterium]